MARPKKKPLSVVQTPPQDAPPAHGDASPGPRGVMPTPGEWSALRQMAQTILKSGVGVSRKLKEGGVDVLLAVMLKGWEVGLKPFSALRMIFVDEDGGLSMAAEGIRAAVEGSGVGYIRPVELTEQKARVVAVRYGVGGRQDHSTEFTFGMEDAGRANMLGDAFLAKYPRDTLYARATSQAGRMMFADVLAGVSYVPGEIPVSTPGTGANPTTGREGVSTAPAPAATPPAEVPAQPAAQETPPVTVAPASVPPPGANGDGAAELPPLTHTVNLSGPNGEIVPVQTAGITRETIQAMIARTTEAGGSPTWRDNLMIGKAYLGQLKLPKMVYLTEAQGQEALRLMDVPASARAGATGGTAAKHAKKTLAEKEAALTMDRVLIELNRVADAFKFGPAEREQMVGLVISAYWTPERAVTQLEQLTPAEVLKAVDEVRQLGTNDIQALRLALGRASREAASV